MANGFWRQAMAVDGTLHNGLVCTWASALMTTFVSASHASTSLQAASETLIATSIVTSHYVCQRLPWRPWVYISLLAIGVKCISWAAPCFYHAKTGAPAMQTAGTVSSRHVFHQLALHVVLGTWITLQALAATILRKSYGILPEWMCRLCVLLCITGVSDHLSDNAVDGASLQWCCGLLAFLWSADEVARWRETRHSATANYTHIFRLQTAAFPIVHGCGNDDGDKGATKGIECASAGPFGDTFDPPFVREARTFVDVWRHVACGPRNLFVPPTIRCSPIGRVLQLLRVTDADENVSGVAALRSDASNVPDVEPRSPGDAPQQGHTFLLSRDAAWTHDAECAAQQMCVATPSVKVHAVCLGWHDASSLHMHVGFSTVWQSVRVTLPLHSYPRNPLFPRDAPRLLGWWSHLQVTHSETGSFHDANFTEALRETSTLAVVHLRDSGHVAVLLVSPSDAHCIHVFRTEPRVYCHTFALGRIFVVWPYNSTCPYILRMMSVDTVSVVLVDRDTQTPLPFTGGEVAVAAARSQAHASSRFPTTRYCLHANLSLPLPAADAASPSAKPLVSLYRRGATRDEKEGEEDVSPEHGEFDCLELEEVHYKLRATWRRICDEGACDDERSSPLVVGERDARNGRAPGASQAHIADALHPVLEATCLHKHLMTRAVAMLIAQYCTRVIRM